MLFFFIIVSLFCLAKRSQSQARGSSRSGVELVSGHGSQEVDKMQTAMSGGCTVAYAIHLCEGVPHFCYPWDLMQA